MPPKGIAPSIFPAPIAVWFPCGSYLGVSPPVKWLIVFIMAASVPFPASFTKSADLLMKSSDFLSQFGYFDYVVSSGIASAGLNLSLIHISEPTRPY